MNASIRNLVFLTFLAAYCREAGAFVRTRGQNDGPYLWWGEKEIGYVLDSNGSDDVSMDDLLGEVKASFQTWQDVKCSYLEFTFEGEATGRKAGYNQTPGAENTNLLIWYETSSDWRYQDGIIAVTTNTFDPYTGEIFDTDIEFNGSEFSFTAGNSHVLTDLRNTLTHELGHFVGLDHSPLPESTMYSTAPAGETSKRTLSDDDINGICAIYPNGQPVDPGHGSGSDDRITGCAAAGDAGCSFLGAVLMLLALLSGRIGACHRLLSH